MTARGLKSTSILGLAFLFFSVLHAEAQTAFRTFVSGGTGNDANPCTRALPCQSLRAAMFQTRTGGAVEVLDATEDQGLFGLPVTITKSISIISAGGRAGIDGVLVVSPEAGGQVLLRGVDILGVGGADAVEVTTGAGISLVIDDCTIQGGANGINFSPQGTATSNLVVRNSIVSKNNSGPGGTNAGILIQPQSTGGQAVVVIESTAVNNNNFGIHAFDNSVVTVRNSVFSDNLGAGIRADQTAIPPVAVSVFVEHSESSTNHSGVVAVGPTAIVRITDVTITNNGNGVSYGSGGAVCSFGNNSIAGNVMTSPPTICPLS